MFYAPSASHKDDDEKNKGFLWSQEMDVVSILRSIRLIDSLSRSHLTAELYREHRQEALKLTIDGNDSSSCDRQKLL